MGVETSIVVQFTDEAAESISESIVINLDDTAPINLDSEGNLKSTFMPGENPVLLIHYPDTVEVQEVRCTDGSVSLIGGTAIRTREVQGLFSTRLDDADADSNKISSGYNDCTLTSIKFFGNTGVVEAQGDSLKFVSGSIPCYIEAEVEVVFQKIYRLNSPDIDLEVDETYPVHVVVYIGSV